MSWPVLSLKVLFAIVMDRLVARRTSCRAHNWGRTSRVIWASLRGDSSLTMMMESRREQVTNQWDVPDAGESSRD